jgi:hypothetical protein
MWPAGYRRLGGNARARAGVPLVMLPRTRIGPFVAIVTAALVVAAPASAKQVSEALACDADDCRAVVARGELRALDDRAPAATPDRPAPFHRIRMTITHGGTDEYRFTIAYVPSLNLVRDHMPDTGEYLWSTPSPRSKRAFDRLTRGLEPVPARMLRGTAPATPRHAVPAPPAASDDAGSPPWYLVLVPALVALGGAVWAFRRRRGVTTASAAP